MSLRVDVALLLRSLVTFGGCVSQRVTKVHVLEYAHILPPQLSCIVEEFVLRILRRSTQNGGVPQRLFEAIS